MDSNRMMVLPPAAHRFICVAKPFTHKLIMTKKRIIIMIISLWVIPTIFNITLNSNVHTTYIPSLGSCVPIRDDIELDFLLMLAVFITSSVLTIISAVYLRHKIIHVEAYICELHRFGMDRRKLNKSQRLKELLTERP